MACDSRAAASPPLKSRHPPLLAWRYPAALFVAGALFLCGWQAWQVRQESLRAERQFAAWQSEAALWEALEREVKFPPVSTTEPHQPLREVLVSLCEQAKIPYRFDHHDPLPYWLSQPVVRLRGRFKAHEALKALERVSYTTWHYRVDAGNLVFGINFAPPLKRWYPTTTINQQDLSLNYSFLWPQTTPFGSITSFPGGYWLTAAVDKHRLFRVFLRNLDGLPAARGETAPRRLDSHGEPLPLEKYRRLVQTLRESTEFSYVDMPVGQFLENLSARHKVPILIDPSSLGWEKELITTDHDTGSLEAAINKSLAMKELVVAISESGEQLVVLWKNTPQVRSMLAAFPVADLLGSSEDEDFASLIDTISLLREQFIPGGEFAGNAEFCYSLPIRGWLGVRGGPRQMLAVQETIALLRRARDNPGQTACFPQAATAKLMEPRNWNWDRKPLREAVAESAAQLNLRVLIDEQALAEATLRAEEVFLSGYAHEAPAAHMLALLLEPHGLSYRLLGETLIVTSDADADQVGNGALFARSTQPFRRSLSYDFVDTAFARLFDCISPERVWNAVSIQEASMVSQLHDLLYGRARWADVLEASSVLSFLDQAALDAPRSGETFRSWSSPKFAAAELGERRVTLNATGISVSEAATRLAKQAGLPCDLDPAVLAQRRKLRTSQEELTTVLNERKSDSAIRDEPLTAALAKLASGPMWRLGVDQRGVVTVVPKNVVSRSGGAQYRLGLLADPASKNELEHHPLFARNETNSAPNLAEVHWRLPSGWLVVTYLPELEPLLKRVASGEQVTEAELHAVTQELRKEQTDE